MNKPLLLAAAMLCIPTLQAQVLKVDTAFTTDVGAGGAPASCAMTASLNSTYGLNDNKAFFFHLAEDFTVPTGQTWNLDTVILYSYQTGSSTTSTINFTTLEIRQGTIGGTVIYGDTTTNRLTSSNWTGIYRVDKNALTGSTRPIMRMKIKITPTKVLTAGTYWMIWSAKGSGTGGVFCPPKVSPGRTNPTGQNAQQHSPVINGWQAASDTIAGPTAVPVGFNYMLKGPQKPSGIFSPTSDVNFLAQNQPNPFSGSTTISFDLPAAGQVKLDVYNSLGQHISTLIDGHLPAGKKETVFNAAGLAAGRYFYTLRTEAGTQMKPMEVLK